MAPQKNLHSMVHKIRDLTDFMFFFKFSIGDNITNVTTYSTYDIARVRLLQNNQNNIIVTALCS